MLGFKRNNSGADTDAYSRQIAEHCAAATLTQLSTAAEQMSVAQLRGYVRAHACEQVWAETQDAQAGGRLTKSEANEVATRALEHTVRLVMQARSSAPVIAMPAPHIGRRAA
jgi:hypothetical protein